MFVLYLDVSTQYHIKWWSCFCSIPNDVCSALSLSFSLSLCDEVEENINIIDDEPIYISIYRFANKLEIARKYFEWGEAENDVRENR